MPPKPLIVILIIALASLWFVNAYSQGACTPNGCYGSNEILFGDFENFSSANPFSNFSSDYAYNGPCVTGANGCGNYLCQFTFAVNNQLFPCNITWSPNIHDHTTGNGNMMVVDFPNNGPEQKIWCTQINLQPNKSYCFGAWFINLLSIGSNQGQPAFIFKVNGNTILNSPAVPEDEQWHFYGATFNSGAGGLTELCIYNANWGFLGYDVAIDDIVLREILNGQEPVLQSDQAYICQGSGSVTIPVLQNDTQGNNPALNYATLSVSVPPAFSQGQITNVNTNDGTITFTPTATFSGSANFQYSVCNTSGCCNQALVTISSAPTPLISVNASPSVICSGNSTGLAANGATSYQWAPAGSLSASTGDVVTASPTITTTYTVTGFNSSGCTASSSLSVNVVPQPQINLSVYDTSICLYQSVTVSASGANSFVWTPDFNQMPVPFQYVLVPVINTTYTVTAISGNCTKDTTLTIQVYTPPNLIITPSEPLNICRGDTVIALVSGAGNYVWAPATNIIVTDNTAILFPQTSITYTVTGYDANNCSSSISYVVNVIPKPESLFNCPEELCAGEVNINNNSQNATAYQWYLNGAYQGNTLNYTNSLTDSGTYTLMLIAENNNLCFDTLTCNLLVQPLPIIESVISGYINNSFTANIQLQSSGADSCYLIYNNDTLILQLCDSTSLVQEFSGTGIQNLTYLVKNQYGCVAQYNFAVDIKDATFIYVPNAFSPNNDGINDVFIPWFVKSPTFYLLSIYDRWGKKVFESNSTQLGWDGNYINGPASLGVYVYVIQYALPGYGETKILKGNLSLLR